MSLPDEQVEERRLIEEARAGRGAAVDALLARMEPHVYRYALRMCGREEDAADVAQETLVAAFRGLSDFRGDASLRTWLFQVARSFCIKSRRRRVGQPAQLDSLDEPGMAAIPLPEAATPDNQAHALELGATVRAALSALPEHYREVLLLKDVEGLSAEELSEVTGEKVPAVKSRLHRARLELRRLLEGVLGQGPEACNPCPELAEELSAYAGGDVDKRACERMEAHMSGCARCARACESLKSTVLLCARSDDGEVPAPVKAAIRQAIARLTTG